MMMLRRPKPRCLPSSGSKNEAAAISNTGLGGMDPEIFAAAAEGNIKALSTHGELLHEILTPTKNTVLHIYVAHASYPTLTKLEKFDSSIYGLPGLLADLLIKKLMPCIWDAENTVRPTTLTASQVQRSKEIVTQLLEVCPKLLLQPNNNGDIALHIAARYGLDGVVEVLIGAAKARHGDVEKQVEEAWQMLRTPNKEGDTALHEAARFNHLGVVKKLCREYPDFSYSANVARRTPIYLAAERGYRDLVSEILDSCTYPGYQGPSGKTAFTCCSDLQYKEKTLAQARDEQGWTPLHFAALIGNRWIVSRLLDCDKSIAYIVDKDDKKTALHIAASKGHEGVLTELIYRCPDCCEVVDRRQRNILHYAIENRKFEIAKVVQNHPWMSNILLNGKDVAGNTPLHRLVNIRLQTATESLFRYGKAPTRLSRFIHDARVDKRALNKEDLNAIDIILDDDHTLSEVERNANIYDKTTKLVVKRLWKTVGLDQVIRSNDGVMGVVENNKVGKDTEKEAIGVLLVVAKLIAKVTFAAGFTVPGGYQSEKGPEQGSAILTRNAAFKAFVVTNTIDMIMSSSTVLAYLIVSLRVAFRKIIGLPYLENQAVSMLCAMLAMVIAFITGTYAVLGTSSVLAIVVCVVGFSFFLGCSIWNCRGS
ncbi:ankyrin repeat-containing protein At5g02620-like [Rosa rugosa]|uniref:ankyrin repeat-containing protein At5g02620-like n=1 Tax=Rosa rugosa TaxID=74645 RepID=UPI002B413690|nr:ankyrin repeat-containing protein At5g02620-like [Rosa rugosa]